MLMQTKYGNPNCRWKPHHKNDNNQNMYLRTKRTTPISQDQTTCLGFFQFQLLPFRMFFLYHTKSRFLNSGHLMKFDSVAPTWRILPNPELVLIKTAEHRRHDNIITGKNEFFLLHCFLEVANYLIPFVLESSNFHFAASAVRQTKSTQLRYCCSTKRALSRDVCSNFPDIYARNVPNSVKCIHCHKLQFYYSQSKSISINQVTRK